MNIALSILGLIFCAWGIPAVINRYFDRHQLPVQGSEPQQIFVDFPDYLCDRIFK